MITGNLISHYHFMHFSTFGQLTQRAGNYLVSRTEDTDFDWEDVRGKTIIGGRAGGMPQMILEYVLKTNGIEPGVDVEMVTNLQFTSTAGAFIGGIGEYTAEFDPSALEIEKAGAGYVVRSLGVDSGFVPYTVYMAQKSYIENNPEIIQKFTNAVYKGMLWMESHSSEEVAELIQPHFSESTIEDLVIMINRYKDQDAWTTSPILDPEGFELLQDIMEMSDELSERVAYDEIVVTDFAEKALQSIK